MRHRVYGKKLNRNKNQRTGLFKSLVQSLLLTGTITTSVSKASAIKGMVDKIINQAKNKDTQKLLQLFLNKDLHERLIKDIAPKMGSRNSGYTSLTKLGTRLGDQTMMVKMSLIGAEELKPIPVPSLRGRKSGGLSKAKQFSNSKKEIAMSSTAKVGTPRNDEKRATKKKAIKVK